MRRINKLHPSKIVAILAQFTIFMKESVENLRSGISKNALMLVTEFFQQKHDVTDELLVFIHGVMPTVLLKTAYDKVFIAKEAKVAMTAALTLCATPQMCEVIVNC
jgi:hypothetical protein